MLICLCLFVCVYLFVFICLCLFVCVYLFVFICLCFLFVYVFYLFMFSICLCLYVCVCVSVVCLFVCSSVVCLSVYSIVSLIFNTHIQCLSAVMSTQTDTCQSVTHLFLLLYCFRLNGHATSSVGTKTKS